MDGQMNDGSWFSANGELLRELPERCVAECSHSGDCAEDVESWVKELGWDFDEVDCENARRWLAEFGAWTGEEIDGKDAVELAETVLWLACCELRESGEWFGMVQ